MVIPRRRNTRLTDCNGLEDFFAGNPTNGQLLHGNPSPSGTGLDYAGFVQDDWRVTPRLVLNLGLRYEYVISDERRKQQPRQL